MSIDDKKLDLHENVTKETHAKWQTIGIEFSCNDKGCIAAKDISDTTRCQFRFESGHVSVVPNPFVTLEQQKHKLIVMFLKYDDDPETIRNVSVSLMDPNGANEDLEDEEDAINCGFLTRNIEFLYCPRGREEHLYGICIVCDIFTGTWHMRSHVEKTLFKNMCLAAEVGLLRVEQQIMKRQVNQLQSVFDHIRSKSSMLDEFLKLAEEVVVTK